MTKRIVSGIFILTALGALGVILAGALTSGEQLIVRFLTAVIVAALGLYVISDLRLQADDDAAGIRTGTRPRLAGIDAPPNSTAAFMATVTGRGEAPVEVDAVDPVETIQDGLAEDGSIEPHSPGVGAASSSTSEHDESAVVEDAGSPDGRPMPSILGPAPVTVRAADLPELAGKKPATITDLFARRPSEHLDDSADEQGWPTITRQVDQLAMANGSTMTSTIAAPELDLVNGAPVNGGGNGRHDDLAGYGDDDGLDDGIELLVEPEESTDEVEAEPIADFEYSGDLDAPDYASWPAPPEPIAEPARPSPPEPVTAEPVTAEPVTAEPMMADQAAVEPVEIEPALPESSVPESTVPEPTVPEPTATETVDDLEAPEPIGSPEIDHAVAAEAVDDTADPVEATTDVLVEEVSGTVTEAAEETMVQHQEPPTPAPTVEASGADPTETVNGSPANLPAAFGDRSELAAADYADAPLAPIIDLRDVNATGAGVEAAIRSGEVEVISALIEQGMLSTDGPISDRDVRTMVYVAFTSNELRKLLLAGGSPGEPNPDIDLGPVELFEGDVHVPKALYPGQPAMPAEARSQLG